MNVCNIWVYILALVKGACHDSFQKLILLKLADKISFHLNISSKMKKLQTRISFGSNRRKWCLCYLLFNLVCMVTMFSNFQATFLLNCPKLFGISTSNSATKVRKIWQNFWYQNQSRFEKNWGWCCGSCQALLILTKSASF